MVVSESSPGPARHRGRWPGRGTLLGVGAVVLVRVGLSLVARQTGYLEYNADGYARIVHAAAWAAAPHLEVGVWLPLQFWLTGAALWLWPDLTVTPVALNFLASLASALLLAAIGRRLGGPATGWLTGLLAAAFPWSIWFGLSGLAEAPFAAAVAAAGLGLVAWLSGGETYPHPNPLPQRGRGDGAWSGEAAALGPAPLAPSPAERERAGGEGDLPRPRSPAPLWLAGGALLVSTMLRYEGWFYSLALPLVVLPALAPAERWRPRLLVALALPFAFPAAWIAASALVNGDPFAFALMTSAITAAEGTHETLTPFERLIFYPVFVAGLAWPVVGLALAAAGWQRRQPGVAGYALWVLAELAILSLVTARFSGIGAGRDRYVMSNVVLLLPLAALLVTALWRRGAWGRLAAAAALGLLLWFQLGTLLGRQHLYPAPDTVALAARLRADWEAGRLAPAASLPVEVAVPGQSNDYNESYALQVLTNRPDGFRFFWDLDLFNRIVADQAPTAWITDARLTNPGRTPGQTAETIGRYTIQRRPPPPWVRVDGPARPGGSVLLTAGGLHPGEWAGLWLTGPDGRTVDLGQVRAGDDGRLSHRLTLPPPVRPGAYTLSLRGAGTGATGRVALTVE
jgi:hypothetical protein